MKIEKTQNGLWVPVPKGPEEMPRFEIRTFRVSYLSDVDKFRKLVEKNMGYWEGFKEIKFLNYKNQPVGRQFLCIYQLDRDLEMEVLC